MRAQVGEISAQLAAGLHCLWLLPDQLVDAGLAEDLYRAVLNTVPDRLDVQPPVVLTVPAPRAGAAGSERAGAVPWEDDETYLEEGLPELDFDDGFDIGWSGTGPVRSARAGVREQAVPGVLERLGKELAVAPAEVVARLTNPVHRWRPVIGLRAWAEPDDPGQDALGVASRDGGRGGALQRLFHTLSAAAKEAGLPPQGRPRLFVVARLRDVPGTLTDELDRDIATTAVRWWWGTIGRLDTATVVSSTRSHGPQGHVGQRIRAAVRDEVVTEIAGFDLVLAERLAVTWDGSVGRLDSVLRSCLDAGQVARGDVLPDTALEAGTRRRPGSRLRPAWSRGGLQSWEGRLRPHPTVWYADSGTGVPPELDLLVGQAQQRVVSPWIEDTRGQLARLSARHATRPLAALVEAHAQRPPADTRTHPERAFGQLEVGDLLSACYAGGLILPGEELRLLKVLAKARNILAHRGALRDATLQALCEELTFAHRRWAKL
ncbi:MULTISPECIES: hypothetical protein [unclassified Streptomyces]|uniref:hypothetical protein n=1 Tax=unclassified Streptomyces TaxID=2593676 RepID=UPI003333A510